jgi:hypothetical protein
VTTMTLGNLILISRSRRNGTKDLCWPI